MACRRTPGLRRGTGLHGRDEAMPGSPEMAGSSWGNWHGREKAGRCPGRSLRGRVFLSVSMPCARSLGNRALAISVPPSAARSGGVFLSRPQGRVSSSRPFPSSSLGPCQRSWCQGRGDAASVSPGRSGERQGRDSELFSDLCPRHPPCSLVSARSHFVRARRTTPALHSQQGCAFPC